MAESLQQYTSISYLKSPNLLSCNLLLVSKTSIEWQHFFVEKKLVERCTHGAGFDGGFANCLCGTFIDFDPIEVKLAALNYHWIFVSIGIKNVEDVRKSKGRG